MADIIDLAQKRTAEIVQEAIDLVRRAARSDADGDADGEDPACRICGDTIDPRRMKLMPGAMTCVDCQRDIEQELKSKGYSNWT